MKHNIAPAPLRAEPARRASTLPGSWAASHDPRWPRVAAALDALRDRGRHAVRIVDVDCGAGALLLHALRHARAIGFTAIEGRGIDGSPALIERARAAAARLVDPAIGVEFEMGDALDALAAECDLPADIVLWGGPRRPAIDAALACAGQVVICDKVAA